VGRNCLKFGACAKGVPLGEFAPKGSLCGIFCHFWLEYKFYPD
jgi:hypothetical protein